MSEASSEPMDVQEWYEPSTTARLTRGRLFARRAVILTLIFVALASLVAFLLWHFLQPRTHLMVLRASGLTLLHGPTIPVAGHEISLFEPLRGVVNYPSDAPQIYDGLFATRDALDGLKQRITELQLRTRDTLILYIAAHGIAYNGGAYLVCENFDPRNPLAGLFEARDLLNLVTTTHTGPKLIIWDAGQIDYDPQLGIVANEFPSLLKELVQAQDNSLWVLCSHSDLQRSHRSLALDGSVFGTFVAKGLYGAADTNDNGKVDIQELQRFLVEKVSSWVAQETDQIVSQDPCLFHGTGSESDSPALLSIVERGDVAIPQLLRLTPEQSARRSSIAAGPPRGYLTDLATPEVGAVATGESGLGEGAAAPAAGGDAATDGTATGEPTAAADSPAAGGATAEPPDPRRQLAALLPAAWHVRDRLAAAADSDPLDRPVDVTPQLWRNLQEELIAHEQAIQGPTLPPGVRPAAELRSALARFSVMKDDKPALVRDMLRVKSPEASPAAPRLPVELPALRSLALTKLIAGEFLGIDTTQIDQHQQSLDALINAGPSEFAAQLAELQPTGDHERYYELRLMTQLGDAIRSQAELAQYALQVRRHGEQVAASALWCAPWLKPAIRDADRLRLAGERQILDQIGPDWPARARQALEAADRAYTRAADTGADVARAIKLRNDLMFAAPYCVRLLRESGELEKRFGAIARFLDDLNDLANRLDTNNPSPDEIKELRDKYSRLKSFYETQLASGFSRQEIRRLLRRADAASSWKVQRLLQTPLPDAPTRSEMLSTIHRMDGDVARGFDLSDPPREDFVPDWQRQSRLWELEVKLAALALPSEETDGQAEVQAAGPLPSLPQKNADGRFEPKAVREFGTALRIHYQALANRLESASKLPSYLTQTDAHRRAVDATRALQVLDARDAEQFGDVSVNTFAQNLYLHDLLTWHRERFLQAQADARGDEVAYLGNAAEYYGAQAATILRPASSLAATAPEIEIGAPQRVPLVVDSQREFAVSLKYNGSGLADVWVIVEYDDRLVEIVEQPKLYFETHGPGGYPFRPDLKGLPATVTGIENGQARTLKLQLKSRPAARRDAVLIVKAVTRDHVPPAAAVETPSGGEREFQEPQAYVRHTIDVPIRTLEVVLDGSRNAWTQVGDQLVLRSFPNRVTDYRFGIVNRGTTDREVALKFFPRPAGVNWNALDIVEKRELISRLKPVGQLSIPAAADGATHFAGEPEAAAPPAPNVAAPPAAAPAAPANEKPPAPPTGPSLDHGLIVEVTDPKDPGQTFYKQLDILAQRPRRYVRPKVEYNARLERIEVSVTPRSLELLPPGPVSVECDLANDIDATAEGKLGDVLGAPNFEARLFVNVPPSPARDVILYLHVDDYPRAFVYRVPVGSGVADHPEGLAEPAVRLVKALPGEYQAPAPVTPVVARVDSPVGAFDAPDDYLQMALDENLDQKFGPETGSSFVEDRQANSFLQNLGSDGILSVDTRVGDFQVPLATDHLQNVEINVHGRMSLGGRPIDAAPLTLKIDGAGPRIPYVSVSPWGGFVVAGTDLEVSVTAVDAMSGVKHVEVGFDLEGTGQFSAKVPPVAAVLDPATEAISTSGGPLSVVPPPSGAGVAADTGEPRPWLAILPTADLHGTQTLLVRAIDGAGNASEYYSKRVQVLTPDEAAAKIQQLPKIVEGVVSFRNRPVPAAALTLFAVLEPEEPPAAAPPGGEAPVLEKQVATVNADENGRFVLDGIAPGKYRLSAEGVIRNVPRFGEQAVVVELAPGRVVRADLQLK